MINFHEPPGERRNFVHGRIKRAVGGFVTGGFTGAATGFFAGGRSGGRGELANQVKFGGGGATSSLTNRILQMVQQDNPVTVARKLGVAISTVRAAIAGGGQRMPIQPVSRAITIPDRVPCILPFRIDQNGDCKLFVGSRSGPDGKGGQPASTDTGMRHMVSPVGVPSMRLSCPSGYVLNRDDMCVWHLPRNSRARKWRPGRRPMFTGGDLNAISRAAELGDAAEEIFKKTNPAKKAVARNYRANWRKPLKK